MKKIWDLKDLFKYKGQCTKDNVMNGNNLENPSNP